MENDIILVATDQVILVSVFLAGIGVLASSFIELLKPFIGRWIESRFGEQAYLISIYIARFAFGVIATMVVPDAQERIGLYVPVLLMISPLVFAVATGLGTSVGAEFWHVITDIAYATRDRVRPGSGEPEGLGTVETVLTELGDVIPNTLSRDVSQALG